MGDNTRRKLLQALPALLEQVNRIGQEQGIDQSTMVNVLLVAAAGAAQGIKADGFSFVRAAADCWTFAEKNLDTTPRVIEVPPGTTIS